jgi:mannose-6-phosphate isomerase-like protein (cupin superfamily)
MSSNHEVDEVVAAWTAYTDTIQDWKSLVEGIEPKQTDCGPVYDVPNPIDRPNDSFAIADMRNLEITGPHYHTNGETEIYIVLTGLGRLFVGYDETELKPGVVSVTPLDTTHFTIPTENLVLAVVNTPPFNPDNAVSVTETDTEHKFDAKQYGELKQGLAS